MRGPDPDRQRVPGEVPGRRRIEPRGAAPFGDLAIGKTEPAVSMLVARPGPRLGHFIMASPFSGCGGHGALNGDRGGAAGPFVEGQRPYDQLAVGRRAEHVLGEDLPDLPFEEVIGGESLAGQDDP